MGFTPYIAIAANAAATAIQYTSSRNQAKQLNAIAEQEQETGEKQKELLVDNAISNNTRAQKNMQSELAGARLDAAKSNTVSSGSTYVREVSMSTRLQDEITNTTERALQDANLVYEQSLIDSYNTKLNAYAAKTKATASLASGIGSLFKDLGDLNTSSGSASASSPTNSNSVK